jgi:hypothetical protein
MISKKYPLHPKLTLYCETIKHSDKNVLVEVAHLNLLHEIPY